MKKIILAISMIVLLSGCSVKLEDDFKVNVENSKECKNEANLYYDSNDAKVYLVCIDNISLKDSKHTVSLKKYLKQKDTDIDDVTNKVIKNLIGETSLTDETAVIYRDGGSIKFTKNGYTIVKCNTEEGNKDVYIGTDELDIIKGFENGFCGH